MSEEELVGMARLLPPPQATSVALAIASDEAHIKRCMTRENPWAVDGAKWGRMMMSLWARDRGNDAI